MIHLRSYLKKFIFSLKLFPDYVSIRTKLCLFSLIFSFLMAPIMHATQRNATQRNATQRNATQRNATQRNATQRNLR
ncbi:MAG TPA: hypothetical protein EYN97_08160, partial [Candidatus Lambdaproteobacteria bacterium]|nr:hypothetical protein [Candidatus Lambdaproteobacteria bacterium]